MPFVIYIVDLWTLTHMRQYCHLTCKQSWSERGAFPLRHVIAFFAVKMTALNCSITLGAILNSEITSKKYNVENMALNEPYIYSSVTETRKHSRRVQPPLDMTQNCHHSARTCKWPVKGLQVLTWRLQIHFREWANSQRQNSAITRTDSIRVYGCAHSYTYTPAYICIAWWNSAHPDRC